MTTEFTRLGPGGYPIAFPAPATPVDITGTVTSSQVETTAARGRVKSSFQGAPSPGRRDDVWVYSVSGTVASSQTQAWQRPSVMTVVLPEPVKPPKIKLDKNSRRARVVSAGAGQATRSVGVIDDPVSGALGSRQQPGQTVGFVEMSYQLKVTSRTCGVTRATGVCEQWSDEELAYIVMLLAA